MALVVLGAGGRRRLLVASALALLTLSPGRAQTQNAAPVPLGRLVDVGGYRVHLYCVGQGSPTVVITGAGYSFDWGLVQPEVAKLTRVCAYDHSGIGWSDPGPEDSCSLRVGEIHTALRNAQIVGPYVLVGHSLGALVSRLYASKYPEEVAGTVIVDHAFRIAPPPGIRGPVAVRAAPDLAFQKLSARDYQLHLWATSLPGYPRIMETNLLLIPRCTLEVEAVTRDEARPLGDKPLIVLSQFMFAQAYAELQGKLLSLSSNSKQVVPEKSGHLMMIDRPDVVIRAIREVVEAVQNHARLRPG